MSRSSLPFDPIDEARRNWVAHGWDDAADGMTVVTSIMRVQQVLLGRIDDELRRFELTFARFELLMLLHFSRAGALPMGRIGARLQVHPTSVTSAVDRLERQGFVRRVTSGDDGRVRLVELTAAGRDRVLAAVEVLNARVFADLGLSGRDTSTLQRLLRALRDDREA